MYTLFERQIDRIRERQTDNNLLPICSLPKWLQWLELVQAESRSLEILCESPTQMKHLSHLPLLSLGTLERSWMELQWCKQLALGTYTERSWIRNRVIGIQMDALIQDTSLASGDLTCSAMMSIMSAPHPEFLINQNFADFHVWW